MDCPGIKIFQVYRFVAKDDKPYSATFGQISTKSDLPFSCYKN